MKKKNCLMMLAASIILLITLCGKEGAVGPTGDTGNQGTPVAVSPAVPAGANGQPGSIIYSGTTAPATATGVNGEFYLNRSNGLLFGPKTNAGWGTGFSLKGPAGAISVTGTAGATVAAANIILSETGALAANAGEAGDYYLDKGRYMLYGMNSGLGMGLATFCKAQQEQLTYCTPTGTMQPTYDTTVDNAADLDTPALSAEIEFGPGTGLLYLLQRCARNFI